MSTFPIYSFLAIDSRDRDEGLPPPFYLDIPHSGHLRLIQHGFDVCEGEPPILTPTTPYTTKISSSIL